MELPPEVAKALGVVRHFSATNTNGASKMRAAKAMATLEKSIAGRSKQQMDIKAFFNGLKQQYIHKVFPRIFFSSRNVTKVRCLNYETKT